MNLNPDNLLDRIARKAAEVPCKFRVVAVGKDRRGRYIGIATNLPRFQRTGGGWHAEERLIFGSPPSLSVILLARIGASGDFLPIKPCPRCRRLAEKNNVKIREVLVC